ncbi:YitT family protein [Paraclostridium bifermentans]|uniref:YitT family protein n=1 Tax=Paraclostridium bifermentans TaxID=1490 RepID=UPI000467F3E3|nr:YitT family protein [Paraclostridium bifermentans]MDV8115297.1 YitT family protein [Bacillus sp. BAU-SS-2023]
MILKDKKYKYLFELIILALGCFIMSVGLNMFLEPYMIASGGLTGLAIVLKNIFNTPLWLINLVFNIPLFIFGVKILGKKDAIKTLIGILLLTLFLKVTEPLTSAFQTNDILLSSIAGGIVVGISLGMLFRIDASTGGTELACLILNKVFPFISISVFMFIIDGLVIILAGLVSKNIQIALYAIISLYISVKICDTIVEGFDFSKSFIIITDNPDEISDSIMKNLERGVTFLEGRGGYSKQKKDVLLVVVSRREEVILRKLVNEIDPLAFVIINNAYEVLGEGFTRKV